MILNYIKQLWSYIKSWFASFTFKDWMLLIMSILCIIFFFRMQYFSNKHIESSLNMQDSITQYENKIGEVYMSMQMKIAEIKDLKQQNSDLYAEIKNLKDNPIIITKTYTKFIKDSVPMTSGPIVEVPDSAMHELHWAYDNEPEYFSVSGVTEVKDDFSDFSTMLTHLEVNNELTLDVIETDGMFNVIAKSDNPYVQITGMNSVMIDPTQSSLLKQQFKPKRWSIGPSFGIGVDKNLKISPFIGFTVSYAFIQF